MAGEQPHEHDVPGAFPETPAVSKDLASDPISSRNAPTTSSEQAYGVNPLPATAGAGNPISLAPGQKVPDASTLSNNTLTSNVHDDPELKESAKNAEQTLGVAPIPATGGIGNPVHLAPGEKVPEAETVTGNTLTNNVKLDKESYEKSDSGAPTLPPISPQTEKEAAGAPIFGLGPQAGTTMIPESGLPMGQKSALNEQDFEPTRSGVAPTSTTNDLAGQQPIEPRGVPAMVGDSQDRARVDPEASAIPEAVQEKKELESELKDKVPEEPSTSESGTFGKSEKGIAGAVAGGVAAAGAAAAGGAYAMREKATEKTGSDPVKSLPQGLQEKIDPATAASSQTSPPSGAAPPTSADPEVVHEKQEVQDELKQKVPEEPATSTSGIFGKSENGVTGAVAGGAAAAGAAALGGAAALRNKTTEATGTDPVTALPQGLQDRIDPSASTAQTSVPQTSAAAADPEIVHEKQEVQDELKQKVPEEPATSTSGIMGKSEDNKGVAGAVAGGVAAAGATAAAGAYALREKATESTGKDPVSALPKEVQDSINNMNSKGTTAPPLRTQESTKSAISKDPTLPQQTALGEGVSVPADRAAVNSVPEEVVDSQKQAHVDPEAAANPEAVKEKSAMEKELLSEVKPAQESGEPAPTAAAALSSTAPAATTSSSGAPQLGDPTADVSPISMGSAAAGGAGVAGAAGGAAVLADRTNEKGIDGSKELNAPADAPAKTPVQDKLSAPDAPQQQLDSRDVSPMSKVATKNHPEGAGEGPTVTTGTDSSATPAQSKPVGSRPAASASTPQKRGSFIDKFKNTPESAKSGKTDATGAESTKSKRRSFFGRIKDKLKN